MPPELVPPPIRPAAPPSVPRMRVAWRTDRDGRLLEASPPLGTLLRAPVHTTGRPFADILRESGAENPEELRQALDRRATFTGLRLRWPGKGGDATAHVEMGALPRVDAAREFQGFRGYLLVLPPSAPADASPLGPSRQQASDLTPAERHAFEEIARRLSGREPADDPPDVASTDQTAGDARGGDARGLVTDLRDLVDALPIGVLISRDGETVFANRTLLDLIGFETTGALGAAGGISRLFGGALPDWSGPGAPVKLVMFDGETIAVDLRLQTIDWGGAPATLLALRRAHPRAGEVQASPPPVDTVRAQAADAGAQGASADAIRALEAQARSLETRLQARDAEARELGAVLDTATDGVVIFDAAGTIRTLNRSAEALFGLDGADLVGQPLNTLVTDDSRAVLADYLAGLGAGGVASVLNDGREINCRGPRDGAIPVFFTAGWVGSDEAPRFCAVLRDLTAWKQAEQSLKQARQDAERASLQKSEFLARISHEIRTPLNAILGFAEVMMDERLGGLGNERYREYMKDIHRSGEHVMSLVNDLLDLSKIEAGKMDMLFTAVDANAAVAECVSLLQPQASRARVVMRLSLAPRLPKVVVDERAFKQIVLNILSNAVKYNEAGGQVIVSTARTDRGHAVVRVRDTGPGMTDAEIRTALEPFGQLATARERTGTGLGLPLTKALVEANRASFSIESRKGEGTLVEVAFPPSRVMAD